jgi:beta-galactosamide-alpha-2,3-sialyltransferase
VYIAGINVGLFHFLLSFIKFRSIKTFDDGTANIFLDSPYFIDPKGAFHKVKRLVYWVMGNRYSRSRLINDSLIHYSIYPGYKNIIDNVVYLDKGQGLNKEILQKKGHKRRKAFLLLGACYDKIVNRPQDIELIINKLIFYVDKITDCEFFYLPHPVENLEIFNPSGYSICDTSMVAEDLIHKINNIYDEIMVAGFASSAQFGLAGFCNIKNIVLISNHMRPGVLNLCYMLASKDAELYSLDE